MTDLSTQNLYFSPWLNPVIKKYKSFG